MQIRTSIIILGACLFTAAPAMADGFYADGGFSVTSMNNDQAFDPLFDPEFESLGAHFGKEFSKYLSIEGEALIGLKGQSISYDSIELVLGSDPEQYSVIDYDSELSLSFILGAYGRATLPVTSRLSLFGRLGYAKVEVDRRTIVLESILDSDDDPLETLVANTLSDSGLAYGVGATFDVTDKVYIRGDYSRYDLEYDELDNVMISAGIRF